jgi:hypothetical protein
LHHAHAKRMHPLLIAVITALALPGAAAAHRLTTVAVDYRDSVLSSPRGVKARTVDGGRKLQVSVRGDAFVTVLGYGREPFLLISDRGISARLNSPTAQAVGLVTTAGAGWKEVASGSSFSWSDQRLIPPSGHTRTRWIVPIVVDRHPFAIGVTTGVRAKIVGESWREPKPALWPWLAGGAALLAAAGLLLARRPRLQVCLVVAGLAGAAATVSLTGIALAGIGSSASRWFQAVAVLIIAAAGIGLALRRPPAALVTLGIVAVVAVLEGIAQLGIFRHPVVLSALPGDAARAAVTVAVALGLAAVGFSVLQVEPGSKR